MFIRAALLTASAAAASGCMIKKAAPVGTTVTAIAPRSDGWNGVASNADQLRIARAPLAWQQGLAEAAARAVRLPPRRDRHVRRGGPAADAAPLGRAASLIAIIEWVLIDLCRLRRAYETAIRSLTGHQTPRIS